MTDKLKQPTAHDLGTAIFSLASQGKIDPLLGTNLCLALYDLDKYRNEIAIDQLDQYRASVIPMFVDNGEVTTCTSMSGGAQEHHGMPKELTLMRTLNDGAVQRMAQYRHTGLIEGGVDFYAECAEGVTESEKPE